MPLKIRKDEGGAEEDRKNRQAGKQQYHLVSVTFKLEISLMFVKPFFGRSLTCQMQGFEGGR